MPAEKVAHALNQTWAKAARITSLQTSNHVKEAASALIKDRQTKGSPHPKPEAAKKKD